MTPTINGLFNGVRTLATRNLIRLKNYLAFFGMYLSRVTVDGGTISNQDITREYFRMCEQNGIRSSMLFAWLGSSGSKFRTSTIYGYFSKLYSLIGTNDAVQATDLNQPYLSGNIAPNERYSVLNPNGASRLMAFAAQTFTTDAWWMSFGMNWNGSNNSIASIIGNGSDTLSNIMLRNTTNKFSFQNGSGTTASSTATTHNLIGKNKLLHFVASGTTLAIYVDAVLVETLTVNTNIVLSQLIKGSLTAGREFFGRINKPVIRTGSPTQSQITAENNFFRSIHPEIPTAAIGSQQWATSNLDVVCTPMGHVIPEVTDNTAWSNLTATYDSVYAATIGSAAVKDQAGCLAAAAWCHYNNDSANGAIYGKLYNWYAVRTLQYDIDAYNAANPSTPWRYHVPTQTEFTTLQTTLGGSTVAGGKMKKEGLNYFLSPNLGADNSSGLTLLGGGYRNYDGTNGNTLKYYMGIWGINVSASTYISVNADSAGLTFTTIDKRVGYCIRLIKD